MDFRAQKTFILQSPRTPSYFISISNLVPNIQAFEGVKKTESSFEVIWVSDTDVWTLTIS